MAPAPFLIRTARRVRTRWFRLPPVVLQAEDSDLTPVGPADVFECVFVAEESCNQPDLDRGTQAVLTHLATCLRIRPCSAQLYIRSTAR